MLKQLFTQPGAPTPQTPSTLAQLAISQRARVTGIVGQGRGAQRLYEMGLVEGAEVTLVRRAPMGDPLEVRVMGYSLSLRLAEAGRIQVSVE